MSLIDIVVVFRCFGCVLNRWLLVYISSGCMCLLLFSIE